ncbi:hypothetical protein Leryth_019839 [Lithospermum erythrorhizon]|nr:hypothetical protein Leryth_019839 [Lithospermum erythrorhizon]
MDLLQCKQLRFFGIPLNCLPCKCVALAVCVLLLRALMFPAFFGNNGIDQKNFLGIRDIEILVNSDLHRRNQQFVEVPQIIWGLNNQKIAFARACLTARMLNRTLLMPSLSASLFYKEVDLLQPILFDKVFQFEKFNSLCKGFVQLANFSDVLNRTDVVELEKGSGRRWTIERDFDQLRNFSKKPYDSYEVIRIVGKNPFLWHDHWPAKDYAKVFECLVLVEDVLRDADKVVSRIREVGKEAKTNDGSQSSLSEPYVAVHMRVEKDWMIHCKNLERKFNITEICSSKEQIMERVGNIKGLETPVTVYLAVADSLLEDKSILGGWKEGLLPFEKKKLGVVDIYKQRPYLFQSAIDYEVCLRADVFIGNSFSTFSSLVVLDRTQKMINMAISDLCAPSVRWPSYAYNLLGESNGPRLWVANMSDSNLQSISYGSNQISC